MNRYQVTAVTKILKGMFNNLTVEQTVDLACRIIEVVEEMGDKDNPPLPDKNP